MALIPGIHTFIRGDVSDICADPATGRDDQRIDSLNVLF